jgi:glutaredoxin
MQINSKPNLVQIWSQENCPGCLAAKNLADSCGINYEILTINSIETKQKFFDNCKGARSVPQIIVDGMWIGGLQEFKNYLLSTKTITKVVQ